MLDPHNYARYRGTVIGTGSVSNAAFADLWARLADAYKDNGRVIFGLMNEPNKMPSTEHWVASANAAIAAIRTAAPTWCSSPATPGRVRTAGARTGSARPTRRPC